MKNDKPARIIPFNGASSIINDTTRTYSEADISRLFLENAIFLGENGIPEYRLVELFGIQITESLDFHQKYSANNPIAPHIHIYGVSGSDFRYVGYEAFKAIMRHINAKAVFARLQNSPGQAEINAYRAEQSAKEEAEKEKRRAKREAAKARKAEAKAAAS